MILRRYVAASAPAGAARVSVCLLALALAACGGAAAPLPAGTPEPEPVRPTAAPPEEQPALEALPTEGTETPVAPRCADPYPGGAPYEPTPGSPLRLRPSGSPPPFARYLPPPAVTDPALERVVRETLGDEIDRFGVVVKDLEANRGVAIGANKGFYAASLYKVWVMLEAYRQRDAGLLDFDERYVVSDYYERYRLNPGELEPCREVSLDEALRAMMRVSDNVAANLLFERVGAGNVNAGLRSLGLAVSGVAPGGDLPTTAGGMAVLFEAIGRGDLVSPAASLEMTALLISEAVGDRLPALLPDDATVAHKTGSWENATHDAGIVFSPGATYVIVVLSDLGYAEGGASQIAALSHAVYEYFNPE